MIARIIAAILFPALVFCVWDLALRLISELLK